MYKVFYLGAVFVKPFIRITVPYYQVAYEIKQNYNFPTFNPYSSQHNSINYY